MAKTSPFHGGNPGSNPGGVTHEKENYRGHEQSNEYFSKVCSRMRETLLEPYKNEAGIPPRAAVEGEMPSGLVNLNT